MPVNKVNGFFCERVIFPFPLSVCFCVSAWFMCVKICERGKQRFNRHLSCPLWLLDGSFARWSTIHTNNPFGFGPAPPTSIYFSHVCHTNKKTSAFFMSLPILPSQCSPFSNDIQGGPNKNGSSLLGTHQHHTSAKTPLQPWNSNTAQKMEIVWLMTWAFSRADTSLKVTRWTSYGKM